MQQIKDFNDYLKYLKQKQLQKQFIDKDEQYGDNDYLRFDRIKYKLLSNKIKIPTDRIDVVDVENRFDKLTKTFYDFPEQTWMLIRTNPNIQTLQLDKDTIEDGIYLETGIQDIVQEQKLK